MPNQALRFTSDRPFHPIAVGGVQRFFKQTTISVVTEGCFRELSLVDTANTVDRTEDESSYSLGRPEPSAMLACALGLVPVRSDPVMRRSKGTNSSGSRARDAPTRIASGAMR